MAYKTNVLFLPDPRSLVSAVLFNSETKEFRSFNFTEVFKFSFSWEFAIFRDFVVCFSKFSGKVFKFDLSFIDESKEPNIIPLPHITELKMDIMFIASIQ